MSIRAKALRKRVWYKALDKLERGIMNLTISIVDRVKSDTLAKELVKIIVKIRDASKSAFIRQVECYGVNKVQDIVAQANRFGSRVADEWLRDVGFAWLLTLNMLHSPPGWS